MPKSKIIIIFIVLMSIIGFFNSKDKIQSVSAATLEPLATPSELMRHSKISCKGGTTVYLENNQSNELNLIQVLIINNGSADYYSGSMEDPKNVPFVYSVKFKKDSDHLTSTKIIDSGQKVKGMFTVESGGKTVNYTDYKYQTKWSSKDCTVTVSDKAFK